MNHKIEKKFAEGAAQALKTSGDFSQWTQEPREKVVLRQKSQRREAKATAKSQK